MYTDRAGESRAAHEDRVCLSPTTRPTKSIVLHPAQAHSQQHTAAVRWSAGLQRMGLTLHWHVPNAETLSGRTTCCTSPTAPKVRGTLR